jgi:uncharacterized protein (TIGR00730 family)
MALLRKRKVAVKKDPASEKYPHVRIMKDLLDPNGDAVESWRIFRIIAEFVAGFELLRKYGLAVSIFGTARTGAGDEVYKQAEELAARLAKAGFAIITGGGPGVMEAANVGAFKVGGKSIGLNIQLPMEQRLNPYVTESQHFHFFFTRKVMLAFASEVYIYFPGGFGTLDELFELVTLIQTKKISKTPIILYGKKFWAPMLEWVEGSLYKKYGTVSREDIDILHVVDSVDEAYDYIMKNVDRSATRQV